jgi:aspartate aminotransferase
MYLSERMSRLGTETAFNVLARAKALEAQGRDIVHLEIGEPDFDTPANIVEAAANALHHGWTHYTPAAGIPPLREAIAKHIGETRGIPVTSDHVVVAPGGKPIMFYTVLAMVEPGDEVVMPNPTFPIYESMVNYIGAKPVFVRLREEQGFGFDLDEFAHSLSDKTRLVVLNSPSNPTGGVLDKGQIQAMAGLLRDHPDVWILSDEIYSRILYDAQHVSIAAEPGMQDRTIILDGFSKTYAMTGWRLGYGVMRPELATRLTQLQINSVSCVNAAAQVAGIEALTGPQDDVHEMVAAFRARRDAVVEGLNKIPGIKCVMPQGAFYAFPNVSALPVDQDELARRLMDEAGVAVLSGTAFGAYGKGHLRLSYANSLPNIAKALDRMNDLVARL